MRLQMDVAGLAHRAPSSTSIPQASWTPAACGGARGFWSEQADRAVFAERTLPARTGSRWEAAVVHMLATLSSSLSNPMDAGVVTSRIAVVPTDRCVDRSPAARTVGLGRGESQNI